MATTVSMPQLGETVTEGTILRWAKQVGETIAEDEVLVEISTDKVDTEVPSPVAGTVLEILVPEGETVGVGTPLVVIGEAGEKPTVGEEPAPTEGVRPVEVAEPEPEPAEPKPEPAEPKPEPAEPEPEPAEPKPEPAEPEPEPAEPEPAKPEPPPESAAEEEPAGDEVFAAEDLHPASETPMGPDTGFEAGTRAAVAEADAEEVAEPSEEPSRQLLSPVVRRLIREHEVDVGEINGTGKGGRITRRDVEAYLARAQAPAPEPAPAAAEPAPEPAPAVTEPAPEPAPAAARPAAPSVGEEVELDRLRVRIAENMLNAKRSTAHVWTSVEVDYERVERVRQAHREQFKATEGFSLTYLPFIARATIDALTAYPVVNSAFDLEGKKATYYKKIDLGIGIDLNQKGLVVARVRNADGLRLVGIARAIRELAERGRSGELGIDDLTGSTFTITNPGPFGSFMSAPIINVPNVAILSTDTIAKRPAVVTTPDGQDTIAIRHIGYLGLSWDHRAFDGSTAVLFLKRIKENLESWDWAQELA